MRKIALSLLACTAFVAPANASTYLLMNVTGDATGSLLIDYGPWDLYQGYIQLGVAWYTQNDLTSLAPGGGSMIAFWNSDNGGGLTVDNGDDTLIDAAGPQLFWIDQNGQGNLGVRTFQLTGTDDPTRHYTVTFTQYDDRETPPPPFPAVPEPASWLMMVGGFGLVGGTIRARRKVKVSYA